MRRRSLVSFFAGILNPAQGEILFYEFHEDPSRSPLFQPFHGTGKALIGIHISDWSGWDRSQNPTRTTVSQGLVPVDGLVVRDSLGNILWGNLPLLPDTVVATPPNLNPGAPLPVGVQIRDENPYDNTWLRPRMILTNQGSTTLIGFVVSFPVVVDPAKQIQIAPWYAPGCHVGLLTSGGITDTMQYVCQNLSIAPGAIWPDQGGAVVGLQYTDWTAWNRSVDPFVSTWTVNFTPTTTVKVEALP